MAKLTDRLIRATKADSKDRFLGDGGGLYLRITPAGSRIWVYRYKNPGGITHWLDLGIYPAKALAEARADAATLKLKRREGIDPVEERQQEEKARQRAKAEADAALLAIQSRLTVSDLFERWMTLEICNRSDGGAEMRRMFNKDVFPQIGKLAIEDVRKGHVAEIIDNIRLRGSGGRMAALALSGMRQMFRFAVERDLIDGDPTATIRKSRIHKPTERDRVLSADEIRLLVKKLPDAGMCESSQLALMAMLATCCRIGELTKAHLDHVNLASETWLIPAEHSKNKREHIVFLSPFAIEIFKKLQERSALLGSEWLMPASNKPGAVCSKSLSKQVGDRQRPGKMPMRGRSPLVDALVLPGGKWTPHDLRRTGATLMGELGVRPDVIERCLNHKEENRLIRIYQRHSYSDEMCAAWNLLGNHLESLTTGEKSTGGATTGGAK